MEQQTLINSGPWSDSIDSLEETDKQWEVREKQHVQSAAITANLLSTFLLRVANRSSFVLLSFYLGAHFASASIVVLVLEAFYVSELLLAPIVGTFSDRLGRKPFILAAPILGGCANLCLMGAVLLFPHPDATTFNVQCVVLLLIILAGRLFEGTTTALNTPATLGSIGDTTGTSERRRVRVMTAFEIATIAGIALGIPFGGKVSSLGTWGFLVVIGLHLLNIGIVIFFVKESTHREIRSHTKVPLLSSLLTLRDKRIYTFLPAWLAINTLIGAWMTLIILTLTYPEPAAALRHPGQLLYGGFSKSLATDLLGGFGLLFLLGMLLWMLILPRLRRTTIMSIGLCGLASCISALSLINAQPEQFKNISNSTGENMLLPLAFVVLGVLLFSGFTPAALTQLAAVAETHEHKRGAVMGLYSVVLSGGQLVGTVVGGFAVDMGGFYGLMVFSALLGLLALGSVYAMRKNNHDWITKMVH